MVLIDDNNTIYTREMRANEQQTNQSAHDHKCIVRRGNKTNNDYDKNHGES